MCVIIEHFIKQQKSFKEQPLIRAGPGTFPIHIPSRHEPACRIVFPLKQIPTQTPAQRLNEQGWEDTTLIPQVYGNDDNNERIIIIILHICGQTQLLAPAAPAAAVQVLCE